MDSVVAQGRSTITIEHLTGEVKPIERGVDDSIPGGARNLDGMLIVKVLFQLSFTLPSSLLKIIFSL